MKNTEAYFSIIENFRDDLRGINRRYQKEYRNIEKFKDSEHYAASKKVLDDRRGKEVDVLRESSQRGLDAVIDLMERAYLNRPASTPSDAQLRLLQTLKLRETLTKDELRQAAVSLQDCPLALEALHELAIKHHLLTLDWPEGEKILARDAVRQHLRSLRYNGGFLIARLEDPDKRVTIGLDTNDLSLYDLFRLNVDPANASDCMKIFGFVSDFPAFSAAVDGGAA